jgi:hypothetical protein
VTSINRPEGNITGVSFFLSLLGGKRLELLGEVVPTATTIGVLSNPSFPQTEAFLKDLQVAAVTLGRKLQIIPATTGPEIDTAFRAIVERHLDALLVSPDPLFLAQREQIVTLAASYAVPVIYQVREFPVIGGLMSYGTSIVDAYRQAGVYVGRILKGEKPADLPVMQPTKFELVINLKTAKALGLTIPETLPSDRRRGDPVDCCPKQTWEVWLCFREGPLSEAIGRPAHRPSELLAFVQFHGIFPNLRLLAIRRLSSNSAAPFNARTRTLASTAGSRPIVLKIERASSCTGLGALRAQRTLAARRAISLLASAESFAARAIPPFALPLGSPIASILLYACMHHACINRAFLAICRLFIAGNRILQKNSAREEHRGNPGRPRCRGFSPPWGSEGAVRGASAGEPRDGCSMSRTHLFGLSERIAETPMWRYVVLGARIDNWLEVPDPPPAQTTRKPSRGP